MSVVLGSYSPEPPLPVGCYTPLEPAIELKVKRVKVAYNAQHNSKVGCLAQPRVVVKVKVVPARQQVGLSPCGAQPGVSRRRWGEKRWAKRRRRWRRWRRMQDKRTGNAFLFTRKRAGPAMTQKPRFVFVTFSPKYKNSIAH